MSTRVGPLSGPQKFSVKETKTYLWQNYSRFARPLIGLGAWAKHICYSHLVCGRTKCVWCVYANIQAAGQMYIYLHFAHTVRVNFSSEIFCTVQNQWEECIQDKRVSTKKDVCQASASCLTALASSWSNPRLCLD